MPTYEDPKTEHIEYPPDGYIHLNVDDARTRVGWMNARKVIMTLFWLFLTVIIMGACIMALTVLL